MPKNFRSAHDLRDVAKTRAENPSLKARFLHSKAVTSIRRGLQSPGAAMATGARKTGKVAITLVAVPFPGVGDVLKEAYDKFMQWARTKSNELDLRNKGSISPAEYVKFSFKTIGGQVENWDRFRWKIKEAAEQLNREIDNFNLKEKAGGHTCEDWVRLFEAKAYLERRIRKLNESLDAVQAIREKMNEWLKEVETHQKPFLEKLDQEYEKEYSNAFLWISDEALHAQCNDDYCTHSTKNLVTATVAADGPAGWFSAGVEIASAAESALSEAF